MKSAPPHAAPLACVLGSMDLVRPLGLAGINVAVVAGRDDAARFSRFVRAVVAVDPGQTTAQFLERLSGFGGRQAWRPVLYYDSDATLRLISRHEDLLREWFDFVIPQASIVNDLIDKRRFQKLAERLSLPVPQTRVLPAGTVGPAPDPDLRFPIIIKPESHADHERWQAFVPRGKAVHVGSAGEFKATWPLLAAAGVRAVAQELIPGHERRIVSYHAYIGNDGTIVGEFTGRKIRTFPRQYGDTSALMVTADQEVAELGRDILRRLSFTGVAKLDFKRAPDDRLHLLEINPRFSLWHHAGAAAGVNLPALVYGDLTGRPRPPFVQARAGTTWTKAWRDVVVARQEGVSFGHWLRWAARADTTAVLAWDDPLPFLRGMVWPQVRRRLGVGGTHAGRGARCGIAGASPP